MARIKLTDDVIQELRRLREETGVGPQLLLRGCEGIPRGLSAAAITAWLRGTTKRVSEHHLNYVLERWRSVTPRIKIKCAHLAEIRRHALRSGVEWHSLLSSIEPRPEGLDGQTISSWVNGYVKTARTDHLTAVIDTLRSLPDKQVSVPQPYLGSTDFKRRLKFSSAEREALIAERNRSGVSQAEMLRRFYQGNAPAGLSAAMISAWINNNPRTVPAELYEWTLAAWKALPDKPA